VRIDGDVVPMTPGGATPAVKADKPAAPAATATPPAQPEKK
jgi:hypothetical protein